MRNKKNSNCPSCKGKTIEQNNTISKEVEIDVLHKKIKLLESEYKARINTLSEYYETLLANKEIEHIRAKFKCAISELEKLKELINKNYIIYGWLPKNVLSEAIEKQISELESK